MDENDRYSIERQSEIEMRDENDDAADIRYSLTALGEATLAGEARRTRGVRFRGFGPCTRVA